MKKKNTKNEKNIPKDWLPIDIFPKNDGFRIPWETYSEEQAIEDVKKFANEYPEVIQEFKKEK